MDVAADDRLARARSFIRLALTYGVARHWLSQLRRLDMRQASPGMSVL